jgi:Carbohydrate binding domain
MRWTGLAGCLALLSVSQLLVACGGDDDDGAPPGVAGTSSGGSGSGGKDAGGDDSGGSTSGAGKGGSNVGGGGGSGAGAGAGVGGSAGGTGGTAGGTPLCTKDLDCPDDFNPCTDEKCVDGECAHPDNTADCTDGNDCTDDVCEGGACKSQNNTANCDDGNDCTDADACADGACRGTNNTKDCDDLSACTPGQDKCADGVCAGARDTTECPVCATEDNLIENCDFSQMLEGWATEIAFEGGAATQRVANERDVVSITEGGASLYCVQPRREPLTLRQGFRYRFGLVAGSTLAREAAVALTQAAGMYKVYSVGDSEAGGFKLALEPQMKPFHFEFLMTDPDDANVKLELKVGGPAAAANDTYFDDVYLREVKCTGVADCNDGNSCTTDACDEATGKCSWTALEDATACESDDQSCTADVCKAGACTHEPLEDDAVCETDDNDCTSDVCKAGECTHPSGSTCMCMDATDCDDLNACTTDSCSVGSGECAHVNNAASCDDSDDCTPVDTCGGGTCGGASVCFDCTAGGNVLTNCNLADAAGTGWLPGFFGGAGTQAVVDGRLVVNVTNGGTAGYMVQPRQEGVVLTQGTTYVVKWNAKASIARKMYVSLTQNGDPYKSYGNLEVDLTTALAAYSFEFTMTDAPPVQNVKFEIQLGGEAYNPSTPNTVTLDNLSVTPKAP